MKALADVEDRSLGSGAVVALGGGYIGEPAGTYTSEDPPHGAPRWAAETTPIDRHIIGLARRGQSRTPRVLLIPTATENSPRHDVGLFIEAFSGLYGSLGAEVDVLRLLPEAPPPYEISAKIADADVVYASGGLTHQLVQTWHRLGVEPHLRAAARSGTVMAGCSAGAVCWFGSACSNSHYTNKPHEQRCMGWIDAVVCPHWNTQGFRQAAFRAMLRPARCGIAIDDLAAIEVSAGRFAVLSADATAWAYRCCWRDGLWSVERLPPNGDVALLSAAGGFVG